MIKATKSIQVEIDLPIEDMRLLLADLNSCLSSSVHSVSQTTKDLRDVLRKALHPDKPTRSSDE